MINPYILLIESSDCYFLQCVSNFSPLPEYIFLKLQIITLIPTSAGGCLVPEDIVRPVVSAYWLYLNHGNQNDLF
jgi:hypothetical protein